MNILVVVWGARAPRVHSGHNGGTWADARNNDTTHKPPIFVFIIHSFIHSYIHSFCCVRQEGHVALAALWHD